MECFFEKQLDFIKAEKSAEKETNTQDQADTDESENSESLKSMLIDKRKPSTIKSEISLLIEIEFELNTAIDNMKKFSKGMNVEITSCSNEDITFNGVLTSLSSEFATFTCEDLNKTFQKFERKPNEANVDEITESLAKFDIKYPKEASESSSKEKDSDSNDTITSLSDSLKKCNENSGKSNELINHKFNIIGLTCYLTYDRMSEAVQKIQNAFEYGGVSPLSSMIFSDEVKSESLQSSTPNDKLRRNNQRKRRSTVAFRNKKLNESQMDCVKQALDSENMFIIHGPPGTGKTTVLVEIVTQLMARNKKVLFCGPSNAAVDNLLLKFPVKTKNIVRLGRLARIDKRNYKFHIDSILRKPNSGRKSKKSKKETLEEKDEKLQLLEKASLICSTLTSVNFRFLSQIKNENPENYPFDVIIIDECSQALISACMIPLELSNKLLIAGDHKQLPPTVLAAKYANSEEAQSFMEYLSKRVPETEVKMLHIQYRMNSLIMDWPSKQFYESKLVAHQSCANESLNNLIQAKQTFPKLLLIDCSGSSGRNEIRIKSNESLANEYEASVICAYIQSLIKLKIKPSQISVISPYKLQVSHIANKLNAISPLYRNLEVNSADGYQGRENEVIIFSMTRSNLQHQVGFMTDYKRLNVAITRAKKQLAVIVDSNCFKKDNTISDFLQYCSNVGTKMDGEIYFKNYKKLEFKLPKLRSVKLFDCQEPRKNSKLNSHKAKNTSNKSNKEGKCNRTPTKNGTKCPEKFQDESVLNLFKLVKQLPNSKVSKSAAAKSYAESVKNSKICKFSNCSMVLDSFKSLCKGCRKNYCIFHHPPGKHSCK